jgi:hypothetical protein
MMKMFRIAPAGVPFTWRKLVAAGAIVACAPAAAAPSIDRGSSPPRIEWSIGRDASIADAGRVQLTIESSWGAGSNSTWSNDRPIGDLQGLSLAQLNGPTGPVRFTLAKDAGRLDCGGVAGGHHGQGSCSFSVDPRFTAYLEQHGMGAPTNVQAFILTMSGVGYELIDAMQAIGYARPTVHQLASMGIQGVSANFVRGLAQSGYRLRSADDLVKFKIEGVSLDFIREMAAISPMLQHLSADQLIKLRIEGVTPRYVREIAAIGPQFSNLTADDLINFSIHGVRPELVRAYATFTRGPLNPPEVVEMAIHGVTPGFLEQLAGLGYRDFTADDVINLTIHGVTADYLRALAQSGMKRLSADQLVRLRLAGFEPNGR